MQVNVIKLPRTAIVIVSLIVLAGCTTFAIQKYDQAYGQPQVIDRQVNALASGQVDYWHDVKPILDNRCVACHACYDAACQLKTTAIEGLDRGAINLKVYDVRRLVQAEPTRLFEDATTTQEWRDKGFFPVLNEYPQQSPAVNLETSLLYRFLELKQQHPLPDDKILPQEITLDIQRGEVCTDINNFDQLVETAPLWGMPYGLPKLTDQEHNTIKAWLEQGGVYTPRPELNEEYKKRIEEWETFLNQDSNKAQLVNRYLYEHLYLASLYFDDLLLDQQSNRQFFKLVRSTTPPGTPVELIATHRPYDDPGVERPYYRIVPELETIVAKTHKPYVLNSKRKELWNELFYQADYEVTSLPSYTPKVAGNPFISFEQLPVKSRYKFLLDEAQFTIMNFVKGSVCRGQVAINVIRDRFWVFFVDPDIPLADEIEDAIILSQDDLELASTQEDIFMPLTNWVKYAEKERESRKKRDQFLAENFSGDLTIDLSNIWDGDGTNPNAALTVMRHFDYGTVEQGLLGETPQTAWVISYPLLERIHYLLVAGYDVYGNVGHQLLSRVHMDFLRMDGEASFLTMLPPESRIAERNQWHRDAPQEANEFLANPEFEKSAVITIPYKTDDHKVELFSLLKEHLSPVLSNKFELDFDGNTALEQTVGQLSSLAGAGVQVLPEVMTVRFYSDTGEEHYASILKDVVHKNMSSMFGEDNRIVPEETQVTVLNGIVGSYPNAMFRVPISDADQFVDGVISVNNESDYEQLVDNYGVRRTDKTFWTEYDRLNTAAQTENIIEYGVYDLGRYENR